MKKYFIIIFLSFTVVALIALIFIIIPKDNPQNNIKKSFLKEYYRISDPLLDPYDFWIIDDDLAIIHDLGNPEYPIYSIDLADNSIKNQIRSGRGPGEVSPTYYKRLSYFNDGRILLWDAGLNNALIYDRELQYIDKLQFDFTSGRVWQIGLINDSTVFIVNGLDNFINAHNICNNYKIDKDPLWYIQLNDYELFKPLNNYLMKQGIYFTNDGTSTFISFEWSSMITSFDHSGMIYYNLTPHYLKLPNTNPSSSGYALPAIGEHPTGVLDITSDSDYLYVLYSGKDISPLQQLRYIHRVDVLLEELAHSQYLYVYNKHSGEYINEIILPIPAKRLKVKNDYIYVLTSSSMYPTIIKYSIQLQQNN